MRKPSTKPKPTFPHRRAKVTKHDPDNTVQHYTEVLSLPFRIAKQAFDQDSICLKEVADAFEEHDKSEWERIPAGTIDAINTDADAKWTKYQHFRAAASRATTYSDNLARRRLRA